MKFSASSLVVIFLLPQVGLASSYGDVITAYLLNQAPTHAKNPSVQLNRNYQTLFDRQCLNVDSIDSPQSIKWPGRGLVQIQCDSKASIVVPVVTDYELISWQANEAIARGTPLNKNRLSPVLIKASDAPHNMVARQEDWHGKQTKRLVSASTALRLSDLEDPIAIKRGQRISLIAQFGKIEATMMATAMQDGRVGESVSVKITHSQRILQGVVVDNQTVAVNSRTKRMGTIANK